MSDTRAVGRPRLGYRLPLQCVAHELAPGGAPQDAEILVSGYSLCYHCGITFLQHLLEGAERTERDILRMYRDGLIGVTR